MDRELIIVATIIYTIACAYDLYTWYKERDEFKKD